MQYLALVNDVLTVLREDTVATVSENEYSALIGRFVNQAKRLVESKHDWTALRQNLSFNTTAGVDEGYSITGIGKDFKILDVYDVTNQGDLRPVSSTWIARQRLIASSSPGAPQYYAIRGIDANGDLTMDLWPTPGGTYAISVEAKVPQAELTSDATYLSVPGWPVRLKAHELAVRERGEDDGLSWQEIREDYKEALAEDILLDRSRAPGESNWEIE